MVGFVAYIVTRLPNGKEDNQLHKTMNTKLGKALWAAGICFFLFHKHYAFAIIAAIALCVRYLA